MFLHGCLDLQQHGFGVAGAAALSEIQKMDAAMQLFRAKERVLLLMTEHLGRRFSQCCHVQGTASRAGQSEHQLMGERGFPRSRAARNEIQ